MDSDYRKWFTVPSTKVGSQGGSKDGHRGKNGQYRVSMTGANLSIELMIILAADSPHFRFH